MVKQFYSDKDIEELHRNGIKSLQITDDVVLTDLAYEKARKLGMLAESDSPPAAPVRPYLSEVSPRHSKPKVDSVSSVLSQPAIPLTPNASPREALPQGAKGAKGDKGVALEKRIREKVAAQLGNQIDPQLLDSILKRTLKVLGVK